MLRRPSGRISALSDSDRPAAHVQYEEMSAGAHARAWDLRGRTYSGAWPSLRRRCCRAGPGWRVRGGKRDVLYHGLTAGEMLTANCQ